MREVGLLVWEAHQVAVSMLRPGVTTAEIDAAVEEFFREHNAQSLFKSFPHSDPDGPPFPAVTCISINQEVVHGIPSNRKVAEGDIVSIDTGCKLNRWCGDAAVTHIVGQVEPNVRRLVDVTRKVLELAVDLMGKCSHWNDVARAMEEYVNANNFSVVEAFVGHGIGQEMHEDPQVPNFVGKRLRRSGNFRLKPGVVLAVEPMVNMGTKKVYCLGDRWTQITADGLPSAHFEHTIALSESDGPQLLTAGPNGEGW